MAVQLSFQTWVGGVWEKQQEGDEAEGADSLTNKKNKCRIVFQNEKACCLKSRQVVWPQDKGSPSVSLSLSLSPPRHWVKADSRFAANATWSRLDLHLRPVPLKGRSETLASVIGLRWNVSLHGSRYLNLDFARMTEGIPLSFNGKMRYVEFLSVINLTILSNTVDKQCPTHRKLFCRMPIKCQNLNFQKSIANLFVLFFIQHVPNEYFAWLYQYLCICRQICKMKL